MVQLYLNEQVFQTQADLEYARDVVLQQECDSYHICKMLMERLEKSRDVKADEAQQVKERQMKQEELEIYLDQNNDVLLKIFQ
jgi:dsDNA-binding SOS-regulon protein